MSNTYIFWFIIIFCIILPAIARRKRVKAYAAIKIAKRKRKHLNDEEKAKMNEIIQKFIGKECIISTINSESVSVQGTIEEINGGWITVTHDGTEEMINVDYIVKIKEYPRKKKNK